jgi:hypothetical protein
MLIKCSITHPLVSLEGHYRPLPVRLHVALFRVYVQVLVSLYLQLLSTNKMVFMAGSAMPTGEVFSLSEFL